MDERVLEQRLDVFKKNRIYKYKDNFKRYLEMYSKYAEYLSPDDFDTAVQKAYKLHENDFLKGLKSGELGFSLPDGIRDKYVNDLKEIFCSCVEEILFKMAEEKKKHS